MKPVARDATAEMMAAMLEACVLPNGKSLRGTYGLQTMLANIFQAAWDAAPTVPPPTTPEIDAIRGRLWAWAADETEWTCTNGHDLCDQSYPGSECPYCDKSITTEGELMLAAAAALNAQERTIGELREDLREAERTNDALCHEALEHDRTIGELREALGNFLKDTEGNHSIPKWAKIGAHARKVMQTLISLLEKK